MKQFKTFLTILAVGLFVTACGSNKRDISMNIQSDPLGAYTLMQVKYSGQENSDWVYLGPTPVTMDRTLDLDKATEVSLKVIRPGFFEQVKSGLLGAVLAIRGDEVEGLIFERASKFNHSWRQLLTTRAPSPDDEKDDFAVEI